MRSLAAIISETAKLARVPRDYLEAIVDVESSGGMAGASRFEPRYRYLWDVEKGAPMSPRPSGAELHHVEPPDRFTGHPEVERLTSRKNARQLEWITCRLSFGPAQILGAVARERGFDRPFLVELERPEVGTLYAAKHLRWCMDCAHSSREALLSESAMFRALRRYNGSSAYPPKVEAARARLYAGPAAV